MASLETTAVASGVQPGEGLSRYLSLINRASAATAIPAEEIAPILNRIHAAGIALGADIRQLATHGVPIYKWIAEEADVSEAEVRHLVAQGRVGSATFLAALEAHLDDPAADALSA